MAYLTIFSAPKPFTDPHVALIQRNAIRSWVALGHEVEVLLLGEEEGLAQAADELKVRHLPGLRRNASGTPLIPSMIASARSNSDSPIFVLINADILLLPGFVESVHQVDKQTGRFLMIGHRWDLDVTRPIQFQTGWDEQLRQRVQAEGKLHKSKGSDYFIFRRDQMQDLPDFAIGRAGWDNWTIYHARKKGWPVVDVTPDVTVVHQQHDYSHLPGGVIHYTLPESDENLRLAGGKRHIFTLLDANRVLEGGRVRRYPCSFKKLLRSFETFPVLHGDHGFWMDFSFYLIHPVKFIRHKLPWLARLLRIPPHATPEDS